MDWASTLIGAGIGFVSSVGIILVERLINKAGRLKVYYKIVHDHPTGTHTWGFQLEDQGTFLNVPIWLEIENTSNSTRVLRDVNLLLYRNGKKIGEMIQSNYCGKKEDPFFFGNRGSYSFIAEPRSIQKYECHFLLQRKPLEDQEFDELKLRYFGEHDCEHVYSIGKIKGNWQIGDFQRPNGWKNIK